MFDIGLATHRRGFIGRLAAGAAALGFSGLAAPLAAETPRGRESVDPSVDAWLNKITGKHKQVFDAPAPHDGLPFAWARVFQMTNAETGAAPADVSAVIVLRHAGIAFAMNDAMWAKYKFGEMFSVNDPATKAPSLRNFLTHTKPGETLLPGMAVDELLAAGALIGVCNVALTVYAGGAAKAMNMDATAVKAEWVANLVPGIQVLPSGVWGVNRTQEHGCTYCFAG
ncbi:MAG TPA: hypothetical protein VFK78_02940 [Gemmatimonadales bacterium]|nr:hypothetical protein [Gemmatimonadales bacterium]